MFHWRKASAFLSLTLKITIPDIVTVIVYACNGNAKNLE